MVHPIHDNPDETRGAQAAPANTWRSEAPPVDHRQPQTDGGDGVDLSVLACHALGTALDKSQPSADHEIRIALRELCDAAHTNGMRAEQVLVLLKDAWRSLPEARSAPRDEQQSVLAFVIGLCIKEFYAAQRES